MFYETLLSVFLVFSFPFHVPIFVEVLIKTVAVTKYTTVYESELSHHITFLSWDQYHFVNESVELILFYLNEHNTERTTLYGFAF